MTTPADPEPLRAPTWTTCPACGHPSLMHDYNYWCMDPGCRCFDGVIGDKTEAEAQRAPGDGGLAAAAQAVLTELDIIRDHRDSRPGLIVHSDTHNDLRTALAAIPPAPPSAGVDSRPMATIDEEDLDILCDLAEDRDDLVERLSRIRTYAQTRIDDGDPDPGWKSVLALTGQETPE